MKLKGKVALVTGSSRGVGRATALTFAREGADTVVNYCSNEEAARETFEKVKAMGRRAILEKADVSSKTEVNAMVGEAFSKFGRVDILVNNAGIIKRDSIQDMKDDDWARVLDVNLTGALNCVRAVLQPMISNGYGKIINISSIGGLVTSAQGRLSYTVSKSGLIALTKKLAIELGPHGINVNAIAPGAIMTDMLCAGRSEEEIERTVQESIRLTVLGRMGQPEDIANTALFLASEESSFITGQVIVVDGGRMNFFSHA